MPCIILITEYQGDSVVAVHKYGRDENRKGGPIHIDSFENLDEMTRCVRVYPDGLGARPTIKRLRAVLERIAQRKGEGTRFEVRTEQHIPDRNPAGPGAANFAHGGRVNPKY